MKPASIFSLRMLAALAGAALVALVANASCAQATDVTRVEEDWQLVVREPDTGTNAPQVTTAMSPTGNLGSLHMAFELNHQTWPSYVSGGLHLVLWDGETPLGVQSSPRTAMLATAAETVRWTQSMRLEGSNLVFEVLNGNSATWGDFGGTGYLKSQAATSLANLNGYDPAVSVDKTKIGFATNRIESLTLMSVRKYGANGVLMSEDETHWVVFHH
ncbi:MAG: hypothetical protein ACYC0Y_27370 [Pirellulales bacterium]